MASKHGTLQRLSKHLRLGGDRQWKDSSLVGKEVTINHHGSKEVLSAGKLVYKSSFGFFVDNIENPAQNVTQSAGFSNRYSRKQCSLINGNIYNQVCLRGIVEVFPKERGILYGPYYSNSRRGEQERLRVNGFGRRIAEYA